MAAAIHQHRPDVPVIMLTGCGSLMNDAAEFRGERPEGVNLILNKPVTIDTLGRALNQVLDPDGSDYSKSDSQNSRG